jgi:membrane associated rhomboid family serine protease
MSDDPSLPPRKIIPIEDLRREARARRASSSPDPDDVEDDDLDLEGVRDAADADADVEPGDAGQDDDILDFERPERPAPGLWDRVGDVHPGFTYFLVLAILIGFATQLVTATRDVTSALAGGSLVGPFVHAGAALRGPFLEGEWWRLFAPIFLHANVLHLGSNLLALVLVGGVVERAFGHARFLVIFVVAAMAGGLATFEHQRWIAEAARDGGAHTLGSIGASGAVYGVGAAVVAAAIRLRGLLSPWRARALIGATLPLLLSSLAGGFARPGTDNAAHLGGALAGALLGFVLPFHPELRTTKESATSRTLWAIAGVVGLSALLAGGILAYLHGAAASR